MLANLKYLLYVLKHKYFVFVAGRQLGVSIWQLLIHDMSKFSAHEWTPYVDRFYRKLENKKEFFKALQHHYENNPHHWNFWVDKITGQPFPIPHCYVLEMIADWMGASRAIQGHWDVLDWYHKNKNKMTLHPFTRTQVEAILDYNYS